MARLLKGPDGNPMTDEEILHALRVYATNKYGGENKYDFLAMGDTIAQVESGNNPFAHQKGGGPGRGKYQYEPPSAESASLRLRDIADIVGYTNPSWNTIEGTKDFSKLTDTQQDIMFLADKLAAGNVDLGSLARGDTSSKDFWLDSHWRGKDADRPARGAHFDAIVADMKRRQAELEANSEHIEEYNYGGKVKLKKYANGGSVGDPTGAFEDFIYGDWEEVGRSTDDAGVTTIKERRTGERDVEYSKRGVDWNVGYDRWLAAGNKGSLADFKIEAERWKKSQSRKETDVQNRERTIEADKEAQGSKTSESGESTDSVGALEADIQNRKSLESSVKLSSLNDEAKRVKLLTSKPATSIDQPEISKELVKKSNAIRPPGETLIEEDSTVGEVLPDSRVSSVTTQNTRSRKKNGKEKVKTILKENTTVTDDEGSTNLRLKVVNKGGKEKHKEVFEIYDSEGNLLAKDVDKTNILGNPVLRSLITDEGKEAGYAFGGRVIRINNKNRGKVRLLKK